MTSATSISNRHKALVHGGTTGLHANRSLYNHTCKSETSVLSISNSIEGCDIYPLH